MKKEVHNQRVWSFNKRKNFHLAERECLYFICHFVVIMSYDLRSCLFSFVNWLLKKMFDEKGVYVFDRDSLRFCLFDCL